MTKKASDLKKHHGAAVPIAKIANKLARERGLKEYSECTVRQQLNGTRTIKPIVMEASELYYKLIN